ncbi:MAG: TlyA family rRNA (cytidine-2'-O)-methyltransferase [Spirochaetae bacterium HGW-Spirochaetae-2]|nr:MAG: TlyA family rRNA (cytidine-2'-O)-methyltransferase [Spirochaetae bacterium HGW-Spirochaetae-2]
MTQRVRKQPLMHLLSKQFPEYEKDQLRAFVDCRQVVVDGETCTDGRKPYPTDSSIELVIPKYVSRGGLKLEHALSTFGMDPTGLVMLDAGSSTGGFTDCLLQHGASLVHAVDVGYNQLDYRLRTDSRVCVHERQNIMLVDALDPQPAAAVADLSFRSITGAASHILSLTSDKWMISLIKPQFELPKSQSDFTGVVDAKLLHEVLIEVHHLLSIEGVGILAIEESPIHGRKGNREFLALLRPGEFLSEQSFDVTVQSLLSNS